MSTWRATAAFVIAFIALDWVSFFHPMSGLDITPWNPQSALAIAFLVAAPGRWWAVALAMLCADNLVRTDGPFASSVLSVAAQTLGDAAIARALVRTLGPRPQLGTRKEFVSFLLVTAVGTLGTAVLHVLSLAVFGAPQASRVPLAIYRAWVGDGVGVLVILPILLLLMDRERRIGALEMLRAAEFWLVALLGCVGTFLVFAQPVEAQFKYFYVLFLPVAWSATRFGLTGAMCIAGLVQLLLAGAVQSARYRPLTVFELQMLMAALAATGLLLGTITEEREQAARKLRLSLRLAAAGEMAAALAHELNQPLAALTTYAQALTLLIQRLDPTARSGEPLLEETGTKLVAEAARASDVVKRLRNFFRDNATELRLASLDTLVDDAVRAHQDRARALGIGLRRTPGEPLAPLWMDTVQIEVVLRNLIANALEAAQPEAESASPAWIDVRTSLQGPEAVVEVRDSGPGLRAGEVRAVFEERRSDKPGGMGVGLAISRAIIEAHGGRMWAEPGPGGHFFFCLPLPESSP